MVAQQRDRAEAAEAVAVEQREIAERAYHALRRESYAAAIETADDGFETGLTDFALSALEKTPVELRNWEWGWLAEAPMKPGRKRQPLQRRNVHEGGVRAVCFHPLGNRMISAGLDGRVNIWDWPSGGLIKTLQEKRVGKNARKQAAPGFVSIASNPLGDAVYTLTGDGRIVLLNPGAGDSTPLPEFRNGGVLAIAHSASADAEINILAAGTREGDVVLWDTNRRAVKKTLPGSGVPITAVALDKDAETIIAGQANGRTKVWSADPDEAPVILDGHAGEITSVALSSDGALAMTGGRDQTARVWRLETGETVLTIVGHKEALTAVGFSPDGERALTGGLDGEVKVTDIHTGKELLGLDEEHGLGPVYTFAFSPDGGAIAVGDGDGSVSWFIAHPWNVDDMDLLKAESEPGRRAPEKDEEEKSEDG